MTPAVCVVAGSEPYPWPYDAPVPLAHVALVACGWDRGWRNRSVDADRAAQQVARLVEAMGALGGHVVAVSHPGAAGQPSDPLPLDGAQRVSAAGIDGFFGSALDAHLRQRRATHLVVVGNGFEAPVHSTLRSANDRGYECLVVVDACASLAPEMVERTISMIHMSGGIFGATATTAAPLAALGESPDAEPAVASTTRRI